MKKRWIPRPVRTLKTVVPRLWKWCASCRCYYKKEEVWTWKEITYVNYESMTGDRKYACKRCYPKKDTILYYLSNEHPDVKRYLRDIREV